MTLVPSKTAISVGFTPPLAPWGDESANDVLGLCISNFVDFYDDAVIKLTPTLKKLVVDAFNKKLAVCSGFPYGVEHLILARKLLTDPKYYSRYINFIFKEYKASREVRRCFYSGYNNFPCICWCIRSPESRRQAELLVRDPTIKFSLFEYIYKSARRDLLELFKVDSLAEVSGQISKFTSTEPALVMNAFVSSYKFIPKLTRLYRCPESGVAVSGDFEIIDTDRSKYFLKIRGLRKGAAHLFLDIPGGLYISGGLTTQVFLRILEEANITTINTEGLTGYHFPTSDTWGSRCCFWGLEFDFLALGIPVLGGLNLGSSH